MADLGFNSRAELIQFMRQNLAFDSASLGKGFITNYNVKPNALTGSTVLAPLSVTNAELAANAVRASKLLVPAARVTGPALNTATGVAIQYNLWNTVTQNGFEDGTVFFAGGAPDRVTTRRLGYYLVNIIWTWQAGPVVGERLVRLNDPAVGTIFIDSRVAPTAAGFSGGTTTWFGALASGQPLGALCFQSSGGALTVTPEIQIFFVSN